MANDSDGSRLLKRPKCDSTDGQACVEPKKARLEHSKSGNLPAVLQPSPLMTDEGNESKNRSMGWNTQFGETSFGTHAEPVVDTPPLSPKSTSRADASADILPDPSEMDIQVLFATLTPDTERELENIENLWELSGQDTSGFGSNSSSIDSSMYQLPWGVPLQKEPLATLEDFKEQKFDQAFGRSLACLRVPFGLKYQTFAYAGSDDVHSFSSSDAEDDIPSQVDSDSFIISMNERDIQQPARSPSPESLNQDAKGLFYEDTFGT
ncbi:unnamed protein product [Clonostachys byssicola]|uniref:Uncharacterized protein n=1 Tax=Clonostachys byssicola TaxID=160290 RepID=A0A9N9USX7_9HYPO|nr:unnamed protein product [Clonostachys byssicola]